MFSWRNYIPFEPGRDLRVSARRFLIGISGGGHCEELSDSRLRLTINIPKTTILGQSIPETNFALLCVHGGHQEHNYACIFLNEDTIEDREVAIRDFPAANRLRVDPSVSGENGADIAFSLRRKSSDVFISDISGFDVLEGVSIRLRA